MGLSSDVQVITRFATNFLHNHYSHGIYESNLHEMRFLYIENESSCSNFDIIRPHRFLSVPFLLKGISHFQEALSCLSYDNRTSFPKL